MESYSDTVTVAQNGTDSAAYTLPPETICLQIHAPATLAEAATLTSAPTVGGTYGTVQSSGSDITIGAGKVVIVQPAPIFVKIHLGGAAANDRVFTFVWR